MRQMCKFFVKYTVAFKDLQPYKSVAKRSHDCGNENDHDRLQRFAFDFDKRYAEQKHEKASSDNVKLNRFVRKHA